MNRLREEADKCELLCANCHSKRHYVNDVVGVVMRLPPKEKLIDEIKNCIVCGSEFFAHHFNRRYCYSCLPYEVDQTDAYRTRKRAVKRELLKYKGSECINCGYNEHEGSLQLHHRNPSEKEFAFSKVTLSHLGFSMSDLKREADKCDVLCANCHAEVHFKNGDDFDSIEE
jgi:ribosomal protein S27AE